MNLTTTFLDAIDALAQREIPDAVYEQARRSFLDYLAVAEAGAAVFRPRTDRYLETAEPEPGIYRPVGRSEALNLKETVFLNGLHGHALDLDDGTNRGIIHLGSPIFSVLLPLARKYDVAFKDFLRAAILGYEASFTLAISIQPDHKARGFHATGTCGTLGIAVAASYLLGLTREQMHHAFATAAVSATGMLLVLDDGSELKPYNVAKTALLGLVAVQMAMAGYKGHPDPLGSPRGFFKMMTGRDDIKLRDVLEHGTWAVEKTYTKPYAACRYCHPPIDAALMLRRDHGVRPEDVDAIDVRTYYWAVNNHDHREISGTGSAKMSIPYSVAVALCTGRAGLREFDETHVEDPEILALTKKVTVEADDAMTEAFPDLTPAELTLRRTDGEELTVRIELPTGEPECPMSDEAFADRFRDLMTYGGGTDARADKILETVGSLEGSMAPLRELLDGTTD